MSDRTYNGWTNYETWLVNLWMSNDEYSESAMRDAIREGGADALKDLVMEMVTAGVESSSLTADLLGAALCEVNWREIAEHYTDDDDDKAE